MSELSALKAVSKARELQERRLAERRRAALVIILRHLVDCGYSDSCERLSTEANLSLNKVDVADNVGLLQILQEYEDNYEARYGQRVKLVRRIGPEDAVVGGGRALQRGFSGGHHPPAGVLSGPPPNLPGGNAKHIDGPPVSGVLAAKQRRDKGQQAQAAGSPAGGNAEDGRKGGAGQLGDGKTPPRPSDRSSSVPAVRAVSTNDTEEGAMQGQPAAPQLAIAGAAVARGVSTKEESADSDDDGTDSFFQKRLLKPIPAHLRGELTDLSAAITRDIFMKNPNVRWDDIAGLETAKKLLKEAVVLPIKYPQLFTGLLAPWKGVLLYGPPGTGKTLLAKAVATECRTTFFNVHASTIISKWRGDSEKLVRVLFELARYHAPSTIFLDEVDALASARGGENEHEASRRMKTELLIQMDGLARSDALVFVLTATNLPWELDMAMLRRLEKRILVPLPSKEARACMFQGLLSDRCKADVDWQQLAALTDGYSGSDVTLVAKEAAMRPLRRLMSQLGTSAPPAPHKSGSQPDTATMPQLEPVAMEDLTAALQVSKASARLHEAKYTQFSEEYGQPGV